jgi:hypothetical protein
MGQYQMLRVVSGPYNIDIRYNVAFSNCVHQSNQALGGCMQVEAKLRLPVTRLNFSMTVKQIARD